jgi:hypothetical protein
MSVDGKWNVAVSTPVGRQEAVFLFVTDGEKLSGTCAAGGTTLPIEDGSVEGSQVGFRVKVKQPMSLDCRYTLTVTGDSIMGEVKVGPFGKSKVVGGRA